MIGAADVRAVYLHGLPGSGAELQLGWRGPLPLVLAPLNFAGFERAVPQGRPVTVIAFSLGARTAVEIAARWPDRVSRLVLIAPAAPLELGDFLPDMAGAAVFRVAGRDGHHLTALTAAQAVAARCAPTLLRRAMFARAPASDRALLRDPVVRAVVSSGWRHSYGPGRAAYLAGLRAYVAGWAGLLERVRAPVTLHHGTADDWAPFAMSQAMRDALGDANLRPWDGLGHYATLANALNEASREVG